MIVVVMNAPFHCTSDAVEAIRDLQAETGRPGAPFRVDVRIGGCQGFKLYFELDERHDDDVVFEPARGVPVVVQADGLPLVAGGVLDFEDSHRGRGFRIANPQARSACGCGQAFYAEVEDETGLPIAAAEPASL